MISAQVLINIFLTIGILGNTVSIVLILNAISKR